MTAYWANETVATARDGQMRAGPQQVSRLSRRAAGTAANDVLLATDLHAGNVLRAQREPWLGDRPQALRRGSGLRRHPASLQLRGSAARRSPETIRRFADLLEVDVASGCGCGYWMSAMHRRRFCSRWPMQDARCSRGLLPRTIGCRSRSASTTTGPPTTSSPMPCAWTKGWPCAQFDELLRLRSKGVHVDGYMLDAFWFDPKGGYRAFRTGDWPAGPGRWLERCRRTGLSPGLWFGTNALVGIESIPEWQDSLTAKKGSLSLFEGGFLSALHGDSRSLVFARRPVVQVRLHRSQRGDGGGAADLDPRPRLPHGTRPRSGPRSSRFATVIPTRCSSATTVSAATSTTRATRSRRPSTPAWLDAFDSLYCGDPRPSDTPAMRFWRSLDIYSDQMARRYEQNGMPLGRIDNCAFMMGRTGTCYYRGKAGWKGSLILLAGPWRSDEHVSGNLEQFTDDDARWFAHAQSIWLPLTAHGETHTFGPTPSAQSRRSVPGTCRRTRTVRSTQSSIPIRRTARAAIARVRALEAPRTAALLRRRPRPRPPWERALARPRADGRHRRGGVQ